MITTLKKYSLVTGLLLVLVPLYSYAEDTPSSPTKESESTSLPQEQATTFTSCSQDAIEKRDNALAEVRTEYNTTMNNALLTRKDAEKKVVAIANEKEKRSAIKNSVEDYKASAKQAQNTLTQARKTIWNTFDTDIKSCRELYEVTKEEIKEVKEDTKETKKELREDQKNFTSSIIDSIKSLFSSTKE